MKKGNKTVKGMTLIEMIISIAVLAMLCVILAMVGQNIDATARATNNLKEKVAKESPYAANEVISPNTREGHPAVEFATQKATMVVRVPGNYDGVDNPSVTFDITVYDTEEIALDGKSAKEKESIQNGPNGGLNLRFYLRDSEAEETPETPESPETPEE